MFKVIHEAIHEAIHEFGDELIYWVGLLVLINNLLNRFYGFRRLKDKIDLRFRKPEIKVYYKEEGVLKIVAKSVNQKELFLTGKVNLFVKNNRKIKIHTDRLKTKQLLENKSICWFVILKEEISKTEINALKVDIQWEIRYEDLIKQFPVKKYNVKRAFLLFLKNGLLKIYKKRYQL